MLHITKPYFSEEQQSQVLGGIADILASGRLVLGPFADHLEQEFADHTRVPYAISVNSCTTALQICLDFFGARGGEVLVPAAGFTTDVSVVRWTGAIPVLVDTDPETLSFDVRELERKLTDRTRGVIWVHLTGLISPQFREIVDFAKNNKLFLIEDCAHAQGASVDGVSAGALGDAGCFSFFATKLMTCGAGGMISTSNPALDAFAREMRMFGRDPKTGNVVREGNDWFLDEFRACIALAQLRSFGQMIEARRLIADQYARALANQPGVSLLNVPQRTQHAYYQYPVFLDGRLSGSRVMEVLKNEHGIQSKAIYRPLHQEPIFSQYNDGSLCNAERMLRQSLCLPMHPALTEEQVEMIAQALVQVVRAQL